MMASLPLSTDCRVFQEAVFSDLHVILSVVRERDAALRARCRNP